jgi:Flp pilus assembly protein TadD
MYLGIAYAANKQLTQAVTSLKTASDITHSLDNHPGEATVLVLLGGAHMQEGNLEEAALSFEDAAGVFNSVGDVRMRPRLLTTLV